MSINLIDGLLEIKSAKTINLGIKTKSGNSNYPEVIFKTGRIKLYVPMPTQDIPVNYDALFVVLINTDTRKEEIITVNTNNYIAEAEGIPAGKYFVILDNVGEADQSLTKCFANNMRRGRIFKISEIIKIIKVNKEGVELWDYVSYGGKTPWENIGKSMGKITFEEGDFSYGQYDDTKTPTLPKSTISNQKIGILKPGEYLCVDQILFDAKQVKGYQGVHQCLRVKVPSDKNITKKPFIWTVYRGNNYIEYASPEPIEIKAGMETSGVLSFKKVLFYDYDLKDTIERYVIDKLENIKSGKIYSLELVLETSNKGKVETDGIFDIERMVVNNDSISFVPISKSDIKNTRKDGNNIGALIILPKPDLSNNVLRIQTKKTRVFDKNQNEKIKEIVEDNKVVADESIFNNDFYPTEELHAQISIKKNNDNINLTGGGNVDDTIVPGVNKIKITLSDDGKNINECLVDRVLLISDGKRITGKNLLKSGDKDENQNISGTIRKLQEDLQEIGFYYRTPNGIFDLDTENSVRSFQMAAIKEGRKRTDGTILEIHPIFTGKANGIVDNFTWMEIQYWKKMGYIKI